MYIRVQFHGEWMDAVLVGFPAIKKQYNGTSYGCSQRLSIPSRPIIYRSISSLTSGVSWAATPLTYLDLLRLIGLEMHAGPDGLLERPLKFDKQQPKYK